MTRWRGGMASMLAVTFAIAAVGCSPDRTSSDASTQPMTASASPSPSPTADATPLSPSTEVPSTDPRPALRYPDVESHGIATIVLDATSVPPISVPLECEWSAPTLVRWLYVLDDVSIAGEPVHVDLNIEATDRYTFSIGRSGAASYVAGPTTGSVVLRGHSDDWARGSIAFEDLSPDPETAPPGPMPSPLDPWIRPLGDAPALARNQRHGDVGLRTGSRDSARTWPA